ncbi:MAG: hypothetical protein BJ554DRAFT_7365 [Olpidium bornovanus]|uniref:Uncharacterized protein n=1 Tax=Olpidium bornovanus TaxID=278681 RepID=A0A8H7ZWK0_9FUNG|nr:MAG: hypothetical protein BJ554DRAFT_7365 [Olpidium bornovanus]
MKKKKKKKKKKKTLFAPYFPWNFFFTTSASVCVCPCESDSKPDTSRNRVGIRPRGARHEAANARGHVGVEPVTLALLAPRSNQLS